MDLRNLLGKLTLIEGTMTSAEKNSTGPKFTGQWKGTDAGTPGKKLVGDSVGYEESILKDLSKGPTPKSKEQDLAEQFESFLAQLEEDNLGVEEKRPSRQGSRPQREYEKTGQPSKRYTSVKEEAEFDLETQGLPIQNAIDAERLWSDGVRIFAFHEQDEEPHEIRSIDELRSYAPDQLLALPQMADESRGHKIVATKLKDIERANKPTAEVDLNTREEQAKAEYRKYVEKMQKLNPNYVPMYKMDEAGANNPPQQATTGAPSLGAQQTGQPDPKQIAATNQALSAIKAGTGSTAPTTNIAKALDAASQGKPVNQTDMKALEPMMKDIATVAQDPKLAGQFKTLAQQIQQVQKKTGQTT